MKRLQPTTLTVVSADECRLRCLPKFDQISLEEYDHVMLNLRAMAINEPADERELEVEFPFTFNEDRGVLQDNQFFQLTTDDYGEMWIDRAVAYFAWANNKGLDFADSPGGKLRPHTLRVDAANTQATRRYKVVFSKDNDSQTKEYSFIVEGGKDAIRTIAWVHGSYSASWESKNWTFAKAPPEDLELLLLAIIRLDEAIHLELMPYAVT